MAVENNRVEEEACIHRFYSIVLSWDYIRILGEAIRKNDKRAEGDDVLRLKKVKNTYRNVDEYLNTFEPLLFEEVKAQIAQRKDEEEESEWQKAIITDCGEINGFNSPSVIFSGSDSFVQNDLVLLSNKKFGEGEKFPTAYAFALVDHHHRDKTKLRLYLNGEIRNFNVDDVQPCERLQNMLPIVDEVQRMLNALKICNLSTIIREYVAMHSISSLPFKDLILSATVNDDITRDSAWMLSRPLEEFLKSNQNESQMKAISDGLSHKSFVLIQGPPGTGKTQTILGILSAILHATPSTLHSGTGNLGGHKHGRELPLYKKQSHWLRASPWLTGGSPRSEIMPINGDDGYFPTSGNELKPEAIVSTRKYRVRVLVCAPSNAALDEIILRLLTAGLHNENGIVYNPKIVRIGLNAHHSVQSVSMDYLVEQKLKGSDSLSGDKQKNGSVVDKDSIRASIVDEAAIVFSTLSFSGGAIFSKLNRRFDVVIIDEAAQAVEPSTLIPLYCGCKQVFLVGDPVQLPATVISPVAQKFGYGMSLFKRFQEAGYPVTMLNTQYRMHPEIRSFPSKEFYHGALEDGPDVEEQTRRSWHEYSCFGPFFFFDLHESIESQSSGSGSWINEDEADFVIALLSQLISRYPQLKVSSRLAIISPYRHQIKLLRDKFKGTFGLESSKLVDINTVDGFQGREKDVAIFSCVRANKERGIGFLSDFRRMNVGITRARSSVLVVGSASTLRRDEHWKNLIESAEQRNLAIKVSKPYSDFFSDVNLKLMEVQKGAPIGEAENFVDYDMEMDVAPHGGTGDAPEPEEGAEWGDHGEMEDGYDGGDMGGDD